MSTCKKLFSVSVGSNNGGLVKVRSTELLAKE